METTSDKPKPYRYVREDGGKIPDVGQLLSETTAEFMDNIGPYALAGLGQLLVVLPVTFIGIIVGYIAMMFAMMFGMAGSTMVGAGIGGDAGGAVAGVGTLASMGLGFLALFLVIGLMMAIIGPVSASLHRGVAAHQRGEKQLELSSAFSTLTQDIVSVLLVAILFGSVVTFGVFLCYLPGILAMIVFGFAGPLVYIGRRGPVASMALSMRHCVENINFYLPFGGIYFVIMMFAAYVPVIGPMYGMALHIRAYRQIFGDGEAVA